jgi:hypothetical protein
MVVATDAVMHVVKYNKVKIISGDMNLAGANFDGYSIFARIYHDVFVPDNKRFGIYVHTGGFATHTPAAFRLRVEVDETDKVTSIVHFPADKLAKFYKTTGTLTVGTAFTKTNAETLVKVGSTVAAGTTVYAVVDGKVVGSVAAVKVEAEAEEE